MRAFPNTSYRRSRRKLSTMRLVCPSDLGTCVPFRIVGTAELSGGRLGGRPPKGAQPSDPSLRYFATVPLATEPSLFVSIFVADLEEIMGLRGRVNPAGRVAALTHALAPRTEASSALDSPLSSHALSLQRPDNDWIADEEAERIRRPDHKIGGLPYLVREKSLLREQLDASFERGYHLVAQFDFPGPQDAAVSGDWPFADGMFALMGREPFGESDWLWYWDF